MEIAPGLIAVSVVLASIVVTWTVRLVNWVWVRPKKLEKCLREQGLNGNPYRILDGDMEEYSTLTRQVKSQVIKGSDDVVPHVLPHLHHIITQYGTSCRMSCLIGSLCSRRRSAGARPSAFAPSEAAAGKGLNLT
ncbi:hypothetical protein RJ639_022977 [Escallonia herrerae]|uniref:Uncharacterized protein n=1 Tax=Escallonia herrerae TaxID=1293975 RepID=A0AA89ADR7_9ASTE|nr:hypothetical protein RJ639_022977 [Escallonia herrerae]